MHVLLSDIAMPRVDAPAVVAGVDGRLVTILKRCLHEQVSRNILNRTSDNLVDTEKSGEGVERCTVVTIEKHKDFISDIIDAYAEKIPFTKAFRLAFEQIDRDYKGRFSNLKDSPLKTDLNKAKHPS